MFTIFEDIEVVFAKGNAKLVKFKIAIISLHNTQIRNTQHEAQIHHIG